MTEAFIVGAATLKFGKRPRDGIKQLTAEVVQEVLQDAQLTAAELHSVWFANAGWGMRAFQHCIRGQVALRPLGIDGLPIVNVENACAGGATALHGAYKDVISGSCEVALALGVEKLTGPNKYAVFAGFLAGTDVEELGAGAARLARQVAPAGQPAAVRGRRPARRRLSWRARFGELRDRAAIAVQLGETLGYDALARLARAGGAGGGEHSPFMDIYAYAAREHMQRYGSTARQLAEIAAKSHQFSAHNPRAQYQFSLSVEQVLADRVVAQPLTRAMCAPIGDGAAAAIVMSAAAVRRHGLGSRAVRIRASVLGSGRARADSEPDIGERVSEQAYCAAGVGPHDIHVCELHDATAFGELHQSEALGFFERGLGGVAAERGETRLGGKLPINPSGGLLSRGHPIAASGLAQIHELVTQLRGEAGARQVQGARLALAENGGGALGNEEAAMGVHILEAP